ncbi:cytochrome c551 [Bacillus sp. CGMCC 1.16607]|uniref:cytochrome c551 n=1 Tax=Bacillus sp. CGMCC 1.16607 TaxID=3351842 RepID=UPI00362F0689
MKKKLLALLMGTGLVLAACGGGGDDEATGGGDTIDAEKITAQKCSSCHGEGLNGGGGAPKISDVGSRYSKDEIEDIILNGKGGMPGGLIKGDEASAVAEWLASKK